MRRWTIVLASLTLFCTCCASASASPATLRAVASHSVVAVHAGARTDSGFAYGAPVRIVTAAGVQTDGVQVIAVNSGAFPASVLTSATGASVLDVAGKGGLRPLRAAGGSVRDGDTAYVLAAPIGYQANKISRVRLRRRGSSVVVSGALPAHARGAAVVTTSGLLIGMLASPAGGHPTVVPVADIARVLASATTPGAGGGLSLWLTLVAALAALVALGTGLALAARQRRAKLRALGQAVATNGVAPAEAPLVQRRPSPDAADPEFEVVLRSQETET